METLKLKLKNETDYLHDQIAKYDKYLKEVTLPTLDGDETHSSLNDGVDGVVEQIPDYAIGNIRLAIGQSNLFINERFRQFSRLMADSEAKRGEKEIRLEDLQGFWEMISYQVDDLKIKWKDIEELRKNNWIIVESDSDQSCRGQSYRRHAFSPKTSRRKKNTGEILPERFTA